MTGSRRHSTRVRTSLIVAVLLVFVSTNGWTLELATVLGSATVTPPSRVGFVEQRHNRLLKEPMVLNGYLEYLEAGQLRKVIESPFEESFFVNEDYVEIERNGKTRRLSLRKSASMRVLFSGIEAILAGQSSKLTSLFQYELSGTADCWSLRLVPLSRGIASQLKFMLVKGDENSANSIRLELEDGEWSLMELQNVDSEP